MTFSDEPAASAVETDRVRIFDTTLRDGEQSPGASLTAAEKLELAKQLARLGVDIIEAGFPAASPGDLDAVRRIAGEVGTSAGPIVAGLARASEGDIRKAWEAVRGAAKPRIHTFLATSELHMARKLHMSPGEVLQRVFEMVSFAKSLCEDVEFSPEDATRSDAGFLTEVLARAIEAGATTLNIPDTVGYAVPQEYASLLQTLMAETSGADGVIWSVHCHDDLGLATANTLAGIAAGARQAEVTLNGIGERAGNTSLEEVVMALQTRRASFGLSTGIEARQLVQASRMVATFTGIQVPANKAIVGANAFAHEAGIHQDGMLKDRRTYEIMTPEAVGWTETQLVLGKHSGRHAFQVRLRDLGFSLDAEVLEEAFRRFKEVADQKKVLTDADLYALVHEEVSGPVETVRLIDLQVSCGRSGIATATVRMSGPDENEEVAAAVGGGPVEAAFGAIDKIVGVESRLIDYQVQSVTPGLDALGGVSVRIQAGEDGDTFSGFGVDADVVAASSQAYLAALNRYLETVDLASAPEISPAAIPDAAASRTAGSQPAGGGGL